MTALLERGRHYPPVERAVYHLARARAWARRATPTGLSIRAVVWLAGMACLLLAAPGSGWLGPALPAAAVLALLAAAYPNGGWVAAVQLAAVAAVAIRLATPLADPAWPAVLLLGAVLYTHHTAAALGAQLRTDAVVPVAVLRHWAGRAGALIAGSLLLGLVVVAVAGRAEPGADTGYLALGVVATVAAVAAVSWLHHHPDGSGG